MLNFGNRLLKGQTITLLLSASSAAAASATITVSTRPSIPSTLSSSVASPYPSRRLFHTSTVEMVARKIDGTAIAK